MKRSRACDDLVALAAETSDHTSNSDFLPCNMDTWTSFVEGPTHRLKRSRAAVCSSNSSDEVDDNGLQKRHPLQFVLEIKDLEEVTWTSSLPSVLDDDSLPLRRNSRENMLLRKKKQRIAEITNSFNDFSIHDKEKSVTTTSLESPETPEPRTLLRGLCFPRKTRCIDPLDKRQAQSFDMSALIMLSPSPKR